MSKCINKPICGDNCVSFGCIDKLHLVCGNCGHDDEFTYDHNGKGLSCPKCDSKNIKQETFESKIQEEADGQIERAEQKDCEPKE